MHRADRFTESIGKSAEYFAECLPPSDRDDCDEASVSYEYRLPRVHSPTQRDRSRGERAEERSNSRYHGVNNTRNTGCSATFRI